MYPDVSEGRCEENRCCRSQEVVLLQVFLQRRAGLPEKNGYVFVSVIL